jgi:hypothetical protein
MINATSSIVEPLMAPMLSTKRCTIGLPTMGNSGFGMVKVCGRILLPMPAIGTIIFINADSI